MEHAAITDEIRRKVPQGTIYLYGSRTNDALRGGDIDLLVIGEPVSYADQIDLLLAIKARIGEQRIDLKLISPGQAASDAFVQSILPGAIKLLE